MRDWVNGSSKSSGDHWVEIEVWGWAATAYVGDYFEWTTGGAAPVTYYYAGGQRVALRQGADPLYLLGDHLGSAYATVNSAGWKLNELRYEAYGETRYANGSLPTARRYTGQASFETTTGLYFYNARWYDGATGRFVQADTLVPNPYNSLDLDRYAYARANPIKYSDPSGHMVMADGPDNKRFSRYYYQKYMASHYRDLAIQRAWKLALTKDRELDRPTLSWNSAMYNDSPHIGTPTNPGKYLGGICLGGGSPNTFYAGGVYADDTSGGPQLVGSSLTYEATYDIDYYENMATLTIWEQYSLIQPVNGPEAHASTTLIINTVDNSRYKINLGQFESDIGARSIAVYLFGNTNQPSHVSVKVLVNIAETMIITPIVPFTFNYQPPLH